MAEVLGPEIDDGGEDLAVAGLNVGRWRSFDPEAVALARRYPEARLVFTGGSAALLRANAIDEARSAAKLFADLGILAERITLERESRNTYENAIFSRDIWKQKGFSSGLLVTSALHMPRSVAIFHKAGMAVVPASTDAGGRAGGLPFPLPVLPDAASLMLSTKALKEWLGLYVYRWRGWA